MESNFQAFIDCSNLTAITIPEGVTEIGDGAFAHCTSLTSIHIPESVTRIGEGVFQNCESLASIRKGSVSFVTNGQRTDNHNPGFFCETAEYACHLKHGMV